MRPTDLVRVWPLPVLAVIVSFLTNPVQGSCEDEDYVLGLQDILQVSVWQ